MTKKIKIKIKIKIYIDKNLYKKINIILKK
jgi:hypothetical protein